MDVSSLQVPVEVLLNLMCQNTEAGYWVIDFENNRPWWSDSYYNLLGIENKNEVQSLDDFLDYKVHPDDRHLVATSIKNYLYYHALNDKHEVRLKHTNGCYNWYLIASEATYDEENKLQFISGSIINTDAKKKHDQESERLKFIVDVTEEMMGIGTFERNFANGEIFWSKTVYDIFELPHHTPVADIKREDFYGEHDARLVFRAIAELRNEKKSIDIEVRIVTAKNNMIWTRVMAMPVLNEGKHVIAMRGTIQKIEKQKLKENFLIDIRNRIKEQKFFLDETSSMSDVGGWELNLEDHILYWSDQTKKIHEVDDNYQPRFDNAVQFYKESSRTILLEYFNRLIDKGEPFDLELEIITAKEYNIWVRVIGKPVYHLGMIIKARGVIQNIDRQKFRELELNSALKIIDGQNSKLKDFTYIVSHNLHSHAGNLKMITEMVELETDIAVKLEWINLIKNVSTALSETVNNLNGLVSLNTETKARISFTQTFANIANSLTYKLMEEEVEIVTDFSACDGVDYLPAYLESIMLNLTTNAIKYKHPERKALIELRTHIKNNKPCLQVKDNGLGIDLEKYSHRLFKMNQTFHQNSDARGIGLYITKNQVENMGGTIEVESIVNEGTTFTVYF